MNHIAITSLAILHVLFQGISASEVHINYPESAKKAFTKNPPLTVELIHEGGEILVSVTNVSSKHISITELPFMGRTWFQKSDGSEFDIGGFMLPGLPKELFRHIVLPPKKKYPEKFHWSTMVAFKIQATHKDASAVLFRRWMGGYFPSIDEYLEFSIEGKASTQPEIGEQAGAGQPATQPADKVPAEVQPPPPTSKDGPR